MRMLLIVLSLVFSTRLVSAGEISTNFWDKCSERAISLHRYAGEMSDYCSKNEVKDLKINNHAALVVIQLLEVHLKLKATTLTPLSEVKKAVKVNIYLTLLTEKSSAVTMQILAFSKLTDEQKKDLIEKTEKANQLITKLHADVAQYIQDVSEMGL